MDELEAAWAELHEVNAALGWYVGRPAYEPRLSVPWSMYAFDPKERPKVGPALAGVDFAIGLTEAHCVSEMAKALREISEGRVPR